MNTTADYVTKLLERKRNALLSLAQGRSVNFSRECGTTREIDKRSLIRQASLVSRELQQRREHR